MHAEKIVDRIEDHYRDRFGRDGFDDAGSSAQVNLSLITGGAWANDTGNGVIKVGKIPSGEVLDQKESLEEGLARRKKDPWADRSDILAHEYAHLVMASEAGNKGEARVAEGRHVPFDRSVRHRRGPLAVRRRGRGRRRPRLPGQRRPGLIRGDERGEDCTPPG